MGKLEAAAAAAECSPLALMQCTATGTVRWANRATHRLLGVEVGDDLAGAVDEGSREQLTAFLARLDTPGQNARLAFTASTGVPVEALAAVDHAGTVTVACYDLSAFHAELDQVRRSARTDSLTGLANRVAFFEAAHHARLRSSLEGTAAAIVTIDMDQFKQINDSHGHGAGDEVLCRVGSLLERVTNDDETVARFGGDEFAVCIPAGGVGRAHQVAEAFTAALAGDVVVGNGDAISVSASIGIARFDVNADVGHVLAEADVAMYRAKAAGQATPVVYRADDAGGDSVQFLHLNRTIETLKVRADVDSRTGLARDHVFAADVIDAHDRACRSGTPWSLLIIDLDSFHRFNERYLYEAGNVALRSIAHAITATVRSRDRSYRYGGEEFTVVLERTGHDEALTTAERVRAAVEALAIPHDSQPGGVLTVSVGVCTTDPDCSSTPAGMINGATLALFAAKDAGRNRVRASPPVSEPPTLRPRD